MRDKSLVTLCAYVVLFLVACTEAGCYRRGRVNRQYYHGNRQVKYCDYADHGQRRRLYYQGNRPVFHRGRPACTNRCYLRYQRINNRREPVYHFTRRRVYRDYHGRRPHRGHRRRVVYLRKPYYTVNHGRTYVVKGPLYRREAVQHRRRRVYISRRGCSYRGRLVHYNRSFYKSRCVRCYCRRHGGYGRFRCSRDMVCARQQYALRRHQHVARRHRHVARRHRHVARRHRHVARRHGRRSKYGVTPRGCRYKNVFIPFAKSRQVDNCKICSCVGRERAAKIHCVVDSACVRGGCMFHGILIKHGQAVKYKCKKCACLSHNGRSVMYCKDDKECEKRKVLHVVEKHIHKNATIVDQDGKKSSNSTTKVGDKDKKPDDKKSDDKKTDDKKTDDKKSDDKKSDDKKSDDKKSDDKKSDDKKCADKKSDDKKCNDKKSDDKKSKDKKSKDKKSDDDKNKKSDNKKSDDKKSDDKKSDDKNSDDKKSDDKKSDDDKSKDKKSKDKKSDDEKNKKSDDKKTDDKKSDDKKSDDKKSDDKKSDDKKSDDKKSDDKKSDDKKSDDKKSDDAKKTKTTTKSGPKCTYRNKTYSNGEKMKLKKCIVCTCSAKDNTSSSFQCKYDYSCQRTTVVYHSDKKVDKNACFYENKVYPQKQKFKIGKKYCTCDMIDDHPVIKCSKTKDSSKSDDKKSDDKKSDDKKSDTKKSDDKKSDDKKSDDKKSGDKKSDDKKSDTKKSDDKKSDTKKSDGDKENKKESKKDSKSGSDKSTKPKKNSKVVIERDSKNVEIVKGSKTETTSDEEDTNVTYSIRRTNKGCSFDKQFVKFDETIEKKCLVCLCMKHSKYVFYCRRKASCSKSVSSQKCNYHGHTFTLGEPFRMRCKQCLCGLDSNSKPLIRCHKDPNCSETGGKYCVYKGKRVPLGTVFSANRCLRCACLRYASRKPGVFCQIDKRCTGDVTRGRDTSVKEGHLDESSASSYREWSHEQRGFSRRFHRSDRRGGSINIYVSRAPRSTYTSRNRDVLLQSDASKQLSNHCVYNGKRIPLLQGIKVGRCKTCICIATDRAAFYCKQQPGCLSDTGSAGNLNNRQLHSRSKQGGEQQFCVISSKKVALGTRFRLKKCTMCKCARDSAGNPYVSCQYLENCEKSSSSDKGDTPLTHEKEEKEEKEEASKSVVGCRRKKVIYKVGSGFLLNKSKVCTCQRLKTGFVFLCKKKSSQKDSPRIAKKKDDDDKEKEKEEKEDKAEKKGEGKKETLIIIKPKKKMYCYYQGKRTALGCKRKLSGCLVCTCKRQEHNPVFDCVRDQGCDSGRRHQHVARRHQHVARRHGSRRRSHKRHGSRHHKVVSKDIDEHLLGLHHKETAKITPHRGRRRRRRRRGRRGRRRRSNDGDVRHSGSHARGMHKLREKAVDDMEIVMGSSSRPVYGSSPNTYVNVVNGRRGGRRRGAHRGGGDDPRYAHYRNHDLVHSRRVVFARDQQDTGCSYAGIVIPRGHRLYINSCVVCHCTGYGEDKLLCKYRRGCRSSVAPPGCRVGGVVIPRGGVILSGRCRFCRCVFGINGFDLSCHEQRHCDASNRAPRSISREYYDNAASRHGCELSYGVIINNGASVTDNDKCRVCTCHNGSFHCRHRHPRLCASRSRGCYVDGRYAELDAHIVQGCKTCQCQHDHVFYCELDAQCLHHHPYH